MPNLHLKNYRPIRGSLDLYGRMVQASVVTHTFVLLYKLLKVLSRTLSDARFLDANKVVNVILGFPPEETQVKSPNQYPGA